jgi:hypothetical protein
MCHLADWGAIDVSYFYLIIGVATSGLSSYAFVSTMAIVFAAKTKNSLFKIH